MIVDAAADFIAIGRLANSLRVQVRDIEAAVERLDITPAMRVNHVIYFNGDQATRLREHLGRGQGAKS